jgi:hypothetical protein
MQFQIAYNSDSRAHSDGGDGSAGKAERTTHVHVNAEAEAANAV